MHYINNSHWRNIPIRRSRCNLSSGLAKTKQVRIYPIAATAPHPSNRQHLIWPAGKGLRDFPSSFLAYPVITFCYGRNKHQHRHRHRHQRLRNKPRPPNLRPILRPNLHPPPRIHTLEPRIPLPSIPPPTTSTPHPPLLHLRALRNTHRLPPLNPYPVLPRIQHLPRVHPAPILLATTGVRSHIDRLQTGGVRRNTVAKRRLRRERIVLQFPGRAGTGR